MTPPRLLAEFASADAFLHVADQELAAGGLLVRGASLAPGTPVGPCTLEVRVAASSPVEVPAQIAATVPGVGVAVMFPSPPQALHALAARLRAGGTEEFADEPDAAEPEDEAPDTEHAPPGSLPARIRAMSVTEKMQLGLSGERDARTLLLRDTNRSIHLYVLRNPRIGLDEVIAAARQSSLAPEALKFISEHKEWGVNPHVCTGLARNPRAPVPLVLKVLPRVPVQELRAIVKGNGRVPIIQAARKLLNG